MCADNRQVDTQDNNVAYAGQRVLLVDDEAAIRSVFGIFLEEVGHRVTLAENGEEALARLKEGPFDVVVTDRAMPGMNGNELAREIKRCWPTLPVVMISGRASGEISLVGGSVDVFVRKPFTLDSLQEAMVQARIRASKPRPVAAAETVSEHVFP